MENQLYWFEKHPKSICPSVQSHYFEVHDAKRHTQKHCVFYMRGATIRLVNNNAYMENQLYQLKIIRNLFVQAYSPSSRSKEVHAKIMCAGRIDNSSRVQAAVFPCDVIRSREEKRKGIKIKGRLMAQWINLHRYNSFVNRR